MVAERVGMADYNGDSQVTNAVLAVKLDMLTEMVKGHCEEARDREKRVQTLERRADVNDTQHGIMSVIGTGFAAIAATIGAWVK